MCFWGKPLQPLARSIHCCVHHHGFVSRSFKKKRSSGPSPTIPSPHSKLLKASVSKLEGTEKLFCLKSWVLPTTTGYGGCAHHIKHGRGWGLFPWIGLLETSRKPGKRADVYLLPAKRPTAKNIQKLERNKWPGSHEGHHVNTGCLQFVNLSISVDQMWLSCHTVQASIKFRSERRSPYPNLRLCQTSSNTVQTWFDQCSTNVQSAWAQLLNGNNLKPSSLRPLGRQDRLSWQIGCQVVCDNVHEPLPDAV